MMEGLQIPLTKINIFLKFQFANVCVTLQRMVLCMGDKNYQEKIDGLG
jgi:hypothetical protein